ncbi:hypothetical protein BCY86_04905 [Pajaroellobacter abortibovis]|uniref:AB hydrolase-1 domain-containing protein n=2 Tax=Pajaroellobacter abortibovis TaxID=1882918 RepID=A0A1L6MX12_9BACT|nr:hypothetical protein BCY86_04905 [Pajaroellobacter abortibovis]
MILHGILGAGINWRSFSTRLTQLYPEWGVVVVDLRLHGHSQGFQPPHTLAQAAADLTALQQTLPESIQGMIGHSFGGKVILQWIQDFHAQIPIDFAWILDSCPGNTQQVDRSGVKSILPLLEKNRNTSFTTREDFVITLQQEGIRESTARWLARNLIQTEQKTYQLGLNLQGIQALLESYAQCDLWHVLEYVPNNLSIHFVIAGKESLLDEEDQTRIHALARHYPERLKCHTLADAGHWVHVDAPHALLTLLAHSLSIPKSFKKMLF